jgi:O-antigen/teichoic acid export membrane protein
MTIFLLVFRFFEVFRTGLTNFTFVLFPSISAMQAQKDWAGIRNQFQLVLVRVFLLSTLVFTFMVWKGGELFSWWSKYNTAESKSLFQVYAFYVFLLVIDHVSVVFLSALKYNRTPSIVSTIQSTASLFLTAVLLQPLGLQGAIWGSLIAFGLTSLIFNPTYLLYRIKKEIAQNV